MRCWAESPARHGGATVIEIAAAIGETASTHLRPKTHAHVGDLVARGPSPAGVHTRRAWNPGGGADAFLSLRLMGDSYFGCFAIQCVGGRGLSVPNRRWGSSTENSRAPTEPIAARSAIGRQEAPILPA